MHKIRLSGLKPGTEYCYCLRLTPVAFKNAYDVKRGEDVVTDVLRFPSPTY